MRYAALTLLMLGGLGWSAGDAAAQDASSIRLLDTAVITTDGTPTVEISPVRLGWGWRGPGWYPGVNRPYGRNYRYGSYYGGYAPNRYYSGYRGYYGPWRY